jgi:hypothetical protein
MKEFKGDKRTKAYKEWKAKYDAKPAGLGDVVEKVTKATGIKKVVEAITDDCGCEERKERWNKAFSFKMRNPLTQEEYELIRMAIDTKKNRFTAEEQEHYKAIFERVFERKVSCTPCSFASTIWDKLYRAVNI